ncbi:uncharacterized protein RHOBADRAFT_56152 [Rhodotorula graminis WP1]|uniref:Small ribosomal subunit protein mS41 n=1 Tax=Rhodotorula graminis (strain WP1) TaxID=578459 RepID=A0A0P9EK26_RHOGW|nr:uncharacterized protein RHOBADRAFT_56152 [Rhodotorula graminis WP1]KPV72016.1 hypothetical protein RHOBADRAFT_56152 [Rhodotorula graminis WP1]
MQRVSQSPCTCARAALAARSAAPRPLLLARAIHAPAAVDPSRRVPKPRGQYTDPAAILAASKRGLESYADKMGSWDEAFTKTGAELRDAGMTVKQSRYTLWLLEKYRQGHDPLSVAVPPTPKKTIRGWGPRVQGGIRVR